MSDEFTFNSILQIRDESVMGYAFLGHMVLCAENGTQIGRISGFRPNKILALFQQPTCVLHRTFSNDIIYLWVAYENYVDFVYCDARNGWQLESFVALSFYYPESLGKLTQFEQLDCKVGRNTLVCAHFHKYDERMAPSRISIVPINVSVVFYCAEKVRQGELSSTRFPTIDMSLIENLRIASFTQHAIVSTDNPTAPPVLPSVNVDQPSVRTSNLGLSHLVLTKGSIGDIDDWVNKVLVELKAPAIGFTVLGYYPGVMVPTILGQYISVKLKILDQLVQLGSDAFANSSATVDLTPDNDYEFVSGIGPIQKGESQQLLLWRACMKYQLMPIDRYMYLSMRLDQQQQSDSSWLCRQIVLETAIGCGLGSVLRDYVMDYEKEEDATTLRTALGDRSGLVGRKYILDDIARVEAWAKDSKLAVETQVYSMLSGQLGPYLLKKAALNYSILPGQFLNLPIAVSSELTLRLGLLETVEVVLTALQRRKSLEAVDFVPNHSISYVPASVQARFSKPAKFASTKPLQKTGFGFITTASLNSTMQSTINVGSGDQPQSISPLVAAVFETSCLAKCMRMIGVLVKHPYLSFRSIVPGHLESASSPSISLAAIRTSRLAELNASQYDDIFSVKQDISASSNSFLLHLVAERAQFSSSISPEQRSWDPSTLLTSGSCAEGDCISWISSLLLYPMNVVTASRNSANVYCYLFVIYQVLDCLWISLCGDTSGNLLEDSQIVREVNRSLDGHLRLMQDLADALSAAAHVPIHYAKLILIMWKFDANIDMEGAVRDLMHPGLASILSEDVDFARKIVVQCIEWELIARLPSARNIRYAYRVVKYFSSFPLNSKVRTAFVGPDGACLLLAALLRVESWKDDWEASKRFACSLPQEHQGAARCRMAESMCRWAIVHGVLGQFLLQSMDTQEKSAIDSFLFSQVEEELRNLDSADDVPTIHLFIHWLIRNNRYADAAVVEEKLESSLTLRAVSRDCWPPKILAGIEARKLLFSISSEYAYIPVGASSD